MEHKKLNYLLRVRQVQSLAQQKYDRYIFISYKEIWKILCIEGNFYFGYRTFLKYMSEPNVNGRIKTLQEEHLIQD